MNFSVPFTWGAPEQDENKGNVQVDPSDIELVSIVRAAASLSKREKSLVLVLIQTISAWGGLQDVNKAA